MSRCLSPVPLQDLNIIVPCGKCIECCKAYSREWAIRCMREMQDCGNVGCFVTLTYAVTDGKLHREHVQEFIKRLRRSIEPVKIRYFGCGEYGGKNDRPHYHINIFGWSPDELRFVWRKNNEDYYSSPLIEKLWRYGFNTVGVINYKTAYYSAKYMQKLDEREHAVRPFTFMSLKPGIGASNLSMEDLLREKIYVGDKVAPLPRYFVKKLEKDGYNVDMIKMHRKEIGMATSEFEKNGYVDYSVFDDLHRQKDNIDQYLQRNLAK